MVLLENIDLNDLKLDLFPKFKCLCELCDDGCFDRRKEKHHPECKKQFDKIVTTVKSSLGIHNKCPSLSHYKETFKADFNARPASMCQPLLDAHYFNPRGSIDFKTMQKLEFQPYEIKERTKLVKRVDNYEKSADPISGITSYKAEYFLKENNGISNQVRKNPNEASMLKNCASEPVSSVTTNKDFFKRWVPKLERGYSEYPSLAGITLFPNRNREFSTSTSEAHKGFEETPRKAAYTKADFIGTLKPEGDMTLETNYRETFVKFKDPERTKLIVPKSTITYEPRKPFLNKSQTSLDFVAYSNHKPPRAAECNTFVSNLNDQIYPGLKADHTTIYASEYPKFDASQIHKTKSCKKENPTYQKPEEKLESETVTHRDFKPIDFKNIPMIRGHKIEGSLKLNVGPMETKTTSMLQFVPYRVKPLVRARDANPGYYNPIRSKFEHRTTTEEAYKGEKGTRAISLKPDLDNIKIDKSESLIMNTSYRDTFIKHGLSLCESRAYLIAKSLAQKNLPSKSREGMKSALLASV